MANIIKKSAKPLTYTLIIISALFLMLACVYIDNFRFIIIQYANEAEGTLADPFPTLFPFSQAVALSPAWYVAEDFYWSLQVANDSLVTMSVVTALCFVVLIVFSSHNRNKFYITNLIVGIIIPIICIIFAISLFSQNASILSFFEKNKAVLSSISLMKEISESAYIALPDPTVNFNLNGSSLIITEIFAAIVIIWSIIYMAFTVLKFALSQKKGGIN